VPSARSQSDADSVTLTGCLVQGSGPNVFVLENAKTSTAAASDKGKSYVLAVAPGTTGVDFKGQLNRQVRIMGSADKMAAAASGAASGASASAAIRIDEKDMPKLSARTIARVGDTCPSA
jgi:hypothetical protein